VRPGWAVTHEKNKKALNHRAAERVIFSRPAIEGFSMAASINAH
jgi:hypothetical protein